MAANSAADAVDVARLRAEPRRVLANRVGDEARREVAVVALDHSGYARSRSLKCGSFGPLGAVRITDNWGARSEVFLSHISGLPYLAVFNDSQLVIVQESRFPKGLSLSLKVINSTAKRRTLGD